MRPLYHPNSEEVTVEGILYALADPVRLQIVNQLASASCGQTCSSFKHLKDKTLAKSTLSQHFRILREAGLIRSERQGVEHSNTLRCAELKEKFGSLLETILAAHAKQGQRKKKRA